MASPNVELVRSIRATWDRGDYSSTGRAHPEIEFVVADGPEPGARKRLAAMAEGMRDLLSAWASFRAEADEYRELDGERVLVLHHYQRRGKVIGLEIGEMHLRGATLYHLRGGKVTRLAIYINAHQCPAELACRGTSLHRAHSSLPLRVGKDKVRAWLLHPREPAASRSVVGSTAAT